MKEYQYILIALTISLLFQCAHKVRFVKNAPIATEEVFIQSWNAGIQKAGSGVDIYIKVRQPTISLDSVYFRGNSAKLSLSPKNKHLYIGRFKSTQKNSNNTSQFIKPAFKLKDDAAVVSFTKEKTTFYFKIENIKERPILNYPGNKSPNY